jgi:1,4-alpha-glucan branching enzyme
VHDEHLVFVYHDDEARRVSLAGDFNGWDIASNLLTKDTSGLWLCKFATPGPGSYQYKFVIDDKRWIEDPSNGMKVVDGFGGLNSVLVVR